MFVEIGNIQMLVSNVAQKKLILRFLYVNKYHSVVCNFCYILQVICKEWLCRCHRETLFNTPLSTRTFNRWRPFSSYLFLCLFFSLLFCIFVSWVKLIWKDLRLNGNVFNEGGAILVNILMASFMFIKLPFRLVLFLASGYC